MMLSIWLVAIQFKPIIIIWHCHSDSIFSFKWKTNERTNKYADTRFLSTRLHFIIIQPHQAQLIGPLHWNCHQPASLYHIGYLNHCVSVSSVCFSGVFTYQQKNEGKNWEQYQTRVMMMICCLSNCNSTHLYFIKTPPFPLLLFSSSSSWLSTQFTFNHVNLLFIKLTRYPFHHVTQRVSPNSLFSRPSNVHSSSPSHENTAQTPREETWKKFPFNNAFRMILWINSCVIFLILWFSSSNAPISISSITSTRVLHQPRWDV